MQYGALPYRFTPSGALELMLVTSRETKRWIIPKGWPIKGRRPAKSAAIEAYEEAGVRGAIGAKSIGAFFYEKRMDSISPTVPCKVRVFPLNVTQQDAVWPEADQRRAQWFEPAAALDALADAGIQQLISLFVATIASHPLK
ncbi:NUDIX hydrolase [Methylocapsa aurea]|uniref:NUDIX hydrolase n=1 Tax=Methylocapsa aurea TaxID=663610 RepID=UPI000B2C9540|nr:NUDIX hydrolase [Methylocapsa aurea]